MQLLNTALLNTAALLSTAPMKKVVLFGVCCLFALSMPGSALAQDEAQPNQFAPAPVQGKRTLAATSPAGEAALSNLPDSPGATWAQTQDISPRQDSTFQASTPSATQTGSSQTGTSQNATSPNDKSQNDKSPNETSQNTDTQSQSQKPQRPVGTAAAEAPKVNGITAAQPAGVAIAPARQRRIRTIVLRVGAIVGAGVAVGTVVALTEGTSSKPPGAH